MRVAELRPSMSSKSAFSTLTAIVLEKLPQKAKKNKEDLTITLLVADETGSVHLTLFDGKGDRLKGGDILRISNGYAGLYKGALTVYAKTGFATVEKVGEFAMQFNEFPNLSRWQWQEDTKNPEGPMVVVQSSVSDGAGPGSNSGQVPQLQSAPPSKRPKTTAPPP